MATQNPYAPPSVTVSDTSTLLGDGEERLIDSGRSCPMGNGWQWYVSGWEIFKARPFGWWLAMILSGVLFIVLSLIPLVNILMMVAFPLFVAGFGSCARSVVREGTFEIGQIFDGFRHRPGALLLSGLLYLLSIVAVIAVIVTLFGAAGMMGVFLGGQPDEAAMAAMGGLGITFFLAYMGSLMLIASLFVFAPFLIQEHEVTVFQAIGASFKGCFKNIPAFILSFILMIVFSLLATLPFLLGWLIFLPVMYLSIYAAYRDIFVEADAAD